MPQHHLVLGSEALGELVGDVHRAVAPAGAADRDGERGALVEDEGRQPALQEALDVLDEDAGLGLALEEGDHVGIVAGLVAQLWVVVRIGPHAARIEDEVRVQGHAALEAERFEGERQARAVGDHQVLHPAAQLR